MISLTKSSRMILCTTLCTVTALFSPAPLSHAHGLQPWMDIILQEESVTSDVWYWKLEHTVHCESEHYSPAVLQGRRLGLAQEIGAVQLHPRGLLPLFYKLGYTDPLNFRQAVSFLANHVAKGISFARAWTCYP